MLAHNQCIEYVNQHIIPIPNIFEVFHTTATHLRELHAHVKENGDRHNNTLLPPTLEKLFFVHLFILNTFCAHIIYVDAEIDNPREKYFPS